MGRTLLLTGRPGVGKTTVIKAVAESLGEQAGGFSGSAAGHRQVAGQAGRGAGASVSRQQFLVCRLATGRR